MSVIKKIKHKLLVLWNYYESFKSEGVRVVSKQQKESIFIVDTSSIRSTFTSFCVCYGFMIMVHGFLFLAIELLWKFCNITIF